VLKNNYYLGNFVSQISRVGIQASPDAVLAVENSAIKSEKDPADSSRYCLDIIRSIAFNPAEGAEISLFLNVTHVTGTSFVVHKFDSCALELQ
jgi:hypothetical protein